VAAAVVGLLLGGWAAPARSDPLDVLFPATYVGNIDKIGFNEPSGLCFHAGRGTLFVVGDEGDVCEIRTDGTPVQNRHLRDADFEGITHDPATGLLYIAIEGEEKVLEVAPEGLEVRREFLLDRYFEGKLVMKPGGQGIEGITFVPDETHPEGGTFYVANQGFDLADTEDPSAIFEVEVPLRTGAAADEPCRILRAIYPGFVDIADLMYDTEAGRLYAVSDAANAFIVLSRDGEVLRAYALPGMNQEGFARDRDRFVYIAQDSGGIIKLALR